LKFTFLFGGRKQAGLFQEGIEDYVGRIRRFFAAEMLSGKKEKEVSKFLSLLSKESYLIGLAEEGTTFTSEQFAGFLNGLMERGVKEIVFLIGGAEGFSPGWKDRCDTILSLSPLTFSHRLTRLVLMEQVYRALSIIHNTPYHR
jgi:23S rRNA (pseudouridine1915-N3)-methyltransferase